MTQTTVRLPDDLFQLAQAHAARTGRSFTELLTDAIRHELSRGTTSRRPAPLPVFGGLGLQSGVDLTSNSALLDLMD